MNRIILALVLIAGITPAIAQTPTPKPRPGLTGNIVNDINAARNAPAAPGAPRGADDHTLYNLIAEPFQKLADFINGDLVGAAQLSVAVPELQDGTGLACWTAMQTAGRALKAHPVPLTLQAATDLQSLRLNVMAANKLCDEPACTVVFSDGINIVQAAAPISLPALPSLSALCSKIAHIKLSPPTQADLDALKAATAAQTPPATPAAPPAQ